MVDIASLFEGKETVTPDEIAEAVKGMKLVDLNDGGYVGKEKFDAKTKADKERIDALTTELDGLKAATDGDEGLRKQLDTLTAKLAEAEKTATDATAALTKTERMAAVSAKVADAKLAKLAYIEAAEKVTDDVTFDEALADVLTDPAYAPKETPPARVSSGAPADGTPEDTDLAAFKAGLAS